MVYGYGELSERELLAIVLGRMDVVDRLLDGILDTSWLLDAGESELVELGISWDDAYRFRAMVEFVLRW